MKTFLKRWGPAILVMGIIFIASNTSGSNIPRFGIYDLLVKKGGHMLGYALLAASFFHGLDNGKRPARSLFIGAVLLAILYAISDEFHQSFTPGRSPAIKDVCIDTIGSIIGIAVLHALRRRFSHRGKESLSGL
jgi:VanZ family protein